MIALAQNSSHHSGHAADVAQFAQAGVPPGAVPIGRIDTLTGTVTAQHVDGSVETLSQGAQVYQRDLIATKAGAKVALVFADKTTFALGEAGQMRLDEMVYDPSHKGGKLAMSVLKGAFAFVSGDIAGSQEDAMTVRTPVGTLGIRGTAVTGNVDPGGQSTFSAVPDPSGAHSTVAFTNGAGTQIVTENFSITVQNFFTAPGTPVASPGGPGGEMAALMSIAGTIAQTINPGGSSSDGGDTGGGNHTPTPPSTDTSGAGGDHSTIHVNPPDGGVTSGGATLTFSLPETFLTVAPRRRAERIPRHAGHRPHRRHAGRRAVQFHLHPELAAVGRLRRRRRRQRQPDGGVQQAVLDRRDRRDQERAQHPADLGRQPELPRRP
jgi:hypothetical protein